MFKYLLKKASGWALIVFLATNLTFFLASAFLDPRSNYLGRRPPMTPEQIDLLLEPYHLSPNTPIWQRWWSWFSEIIFHWNWGYSPTGASVNEEIGFRIWVSAQLMLVATILTIILGVSVGVYTASRQYKRGDRIWQAVSIISMNIHIVVASIIVVAAAIKINDWAGTRVLYVTGASNPDVVGFFPRILDYAQHLILPTIALVTIGYAGYHFMQRSLLLDNINADYVRTARAKGLTKGQAIRKHALRTSIIPVATSVAFAVPGIFTGAVLTEKIFAWNGMGVYFVDTMAKNDVHGAVAVAAFGAALTGVSAILADLVVVALDPRVRVS
ncbi:ABC transporter permease [Corynebacterium caspium]|uniref:ABC transporter permease n=1 Tax=Corynebacterium caspium TaxID=234828 RepID=UPI00037BAC1D|nr:ABC transporter permease [Corynebacterium caspium]WKD58770.1 Dipeptide transport system permease protein DppB [Corynebacterium caspium DSM 44850]